ncbi:hypothetical protein KXD40_006723 [Peronospora effusa]|uniref:RanBP2-type domain-containing protein n=1 Tax=Peronospora effusa TaxID=542832 RepID=A0A3M6VVS2_9STRA|nr:hypothetical protein DD238_000923 [Peronospora effusa]UIZ24583.1 hypothetical protein KXD40_006723 [Peronospora effusa]CAI5719116.1 unnamed protein product [Peronospora effusa]
MVAAMSVSLSGPPRVSTRTVCPTPSIPSSAASQRRRQCSVGPLKGVVAIVDVRVGADAQIDCSDVVARKLRELGASTVKRFTSKLTHVVLSHFTPVWKTKITKWQAGGGSMAAAATRYELKIVSQLWVNACYVSKRRMDECPFFPVSQYNLLENVVLQANSKLNRRQSLGAEAWKVRAEEEEVDQKKNDTETSVDAVNGVTPSTPLSSSFKIKKELNDGRRKRRALSMEPMASDAILKMLGTTDAMLGEVEMTTPKQPIRCKSGSTSVRRRKTLNGPPSQQDEDEATVSQVSGTVDESELENKKKDAIKETENNVMVIQENQAIPGLLLKEDTAAVVMSGLSTTTSSKNNSGKLDTSDDNSSKKDPTARELRRRNRTSLSYGSGLTLKSGIWSCAACGCSNPRTRRNCRDCQVSKGCAKSPGADTINRAPLAAVANAVAGSLKTSALPPAAALTPATPGTKTSTPTKKIRTPTSSASGQKTPITSPSVLERTPRSLTRPTASSAAKVCSTPSPASSRITRPTKISSPSFATRSTTQSPAIGSFTSRQTMRSSLASASVSTDVQVQKHLVKKAQQRLPTMAGRSSAMKITQNAARKRAYSPVSSNTLTTPVVKKARRDSNKENTVMKHMATPGSVSGFLRKHRDVNSTPIPMAMNFSSTTNRKTLRKTPRNVIGITGVSAETRGVLQCAIHAIDANMSNDSGHRKARVVKSVDYTAGVTHLIVGKDARRTIKVLFAIARGAWIVSEDWAFSSLEQERWLPEEDYELTMFANKRAREHPECRQIFMGMKVHVGSNVDPSREVLQSLVQVAGGEICNQISVADICICGDASLFRRAQRTGIRAVTSKWVFDSIAAMKLEDDAKYTVPEPFGTPAKTPTKSRRAAVSGLEAHSTVPE